MAFNFQGFKSAFRLTASYFFAAIYMFVIFGNSFLFYIPGLLYKSTVTLLAKCVMPKARILSLLDSLMARDDFTKSSDMYLHTQLIFEGKINYDEFLEVWEKRVVKKQLPDGKLQFPELQCYIDMWMGYFFYKPDEAFDIQAYVKLYGNNDNENQTQSSIVDDKKLDKIRKEFVCSLFQEKRSPWEIILVNNCKLGDSEQEKSVIIFKIHHCLADGFVLLLLLWKSLLLQNLASFQYPKLAKIEGNWWQRFMGMYSAFKNTFKTVGGLASLFVYEPSKLYDENDWHSSKEKSEHVHCLLKPIETSLIKDVSKFYGVSVTEILLSATTGGFRRFMEAKGRKTPTDIRMTYSLPMPKHPEKLTNYSSVTFFSTNLVSKGKSEKERLKSNEEEMKTQIRGSLNFAMPFLMFLANYLPLALLRYLPEDQHYFSFSALLVTIPMPNPATLTEKAELLGCLFLGMDISIEVSGKTNIPTSICVTKYKQHFHINFGIQKHLLDCDDEVYDIERYVLEELTYLSNQLKIPRAETCVTIVDD